MHDVCDHAFCSVGAAHMDDCRTPLLSLAGHGPHQLVLIWQQGLCIIQTDTDTYAYTHIHRDQPGCSPIRCFLCAGLAEGTCNGSSIGAFDSILLADTAFSLPGRALMSFVGLQAGDAPAAEAAAAWCFKKPRCVRFKACAVPTCCLRTATRSCRCSCTVAECGFSQHGIPRYMCNEYRSSIASHSLLISCVGQCLCY